VSRLRRRLPEVADRDRFAAACLAVDRLLRFMRRADLRWAHYADSSASIVSQRHDFGG
jgi:hypothetical protein